METQKNVNLLNDSNNENSNFAPKKWYVMDSESKSNYSQKKSNQVFNKFIRVKSLWLFWCIYLVARNIAVKRRNSADTADIELGAIKQVALKNCAPFKDCKT